MTIQVPFSNMVAIATSLIICIGLPVALAIYVKWKEKVSIKSLFLGSASFIVSAMVLEQFFHSAVLGLTGTLLTDNVFAYAVYGGLAAGLFEETGRLFTMKVLMKKNLNKQEAIMYGVGHGGIEAMMIGGSICMSNLILARQINKGMMETLLSVAEGEARVSLEQGLMQLVELPAWEFLLVGMERASAVILHICLSYIVYRAVKDHNMKLYGLAILIHALVNALTVLASSVIPVILVEILLMAAVIGMAARVRKCYRSESYSA